MHDYRNAERKVKGVKVLEVSRFLCNSECTSCWAVISEGCILQFLGKQRKSSERTHYYQVSQEETN